MVITCPVIDLLLRRNSKLAVISFISTGRLAGNRSINFLQTMGENRAGGKTNPGAMALTRMPGANALARMRVAVSRALLLTLYAGYENQFFPVPASDILTIKPSSILSATCLSKR